MGKTPREQYLELLNAAKEHYQQIYDVVKPDETDSLLPPMVKLMKDFAFKDLLTSHQHFTTLTNLVTETLQNNSVSEGRDIQVNIQEPIDTTETI